MSARTMRRALRGLHLFAGLGIFGYVYGTVPQHIAQVLFVPLLTFSGLGMWQLPRIRRARRFAAACSKRAFSRTTYNFSAPRRFRWRRRHFHRPPRHQ